MSNNFFSDKTVLVTGGAKGIGASIVRLFAQNDANVIINDILECELDDFSTHLNDQGFSTFKFFADITNPRSIVDMLKYCEKTTGKVDILVNNAGVLKRTRFEQISVKEWDKVLDVNLRSLFLCCKTFYPGMKARGFGRIINMSSSAGRSVSTLGGAHYTVSKAGVIGLTRALAKEAAPYGVTVNAVCPGLIDTEMVRNFAEKEEIESYRNSFPIPRLGTPEEVADLVLFLASNKAAYITGASLDINGGDLMI
ncbi:SDR family oxidoreductase [bacterium]|nr:SDR family oxidoreductase [bacterium]